MLLLLFRSFDSPDGIVVSDTSHYTSHLFSKYEANNIINKINRLNKATHCGIYKPRVITFYRQIVMKITKLTLGGSNFNLCKILMDGNCDFAVLNSRLSRAFITIFF
jgi:hypothetical protein